MNHMHTRVSVRGQVRMQFMAYHVHTGSNKQRTYVMSFRLQRCIHNDSTHEQMEAHSEQIKVHPTCAHELALLDSNVHYNT